MLKKNEGDFMKSLKKIKAVARAYKVKLDKSSAIAMLGQQGAQSVGLYAATRLVAWIPGWGNAVDAVVEHQRIKLFEGENIKNTRRENHG